MAVGNEVGRLFYNHRADVSSYLIRMLRDPDLADDLTQETFLRLCGNLDGRKPENGRAFLCRIARNIAIDHLRLIRRRGTDMPGDQVLQAIADPRPTQENILIDRERLGVFLRALADLPETTRRIFVLHRVEGLKYREVARRMELSESSVQKHLARALLEVTRRLRAYEGGN